jgi:N-acyl-D-amino-acid deacylase
LFSLEEAVRRMTGLPAKWFGFPDRGVLRKGAYADLVVFDPESVNDVGDFVDPARPARGIKMVMVNGTTTWRDGYGTGERPGRVLGRTTAAA